MTRATRTQPMLTCQPAREGQSKGGTPIFGKTEWMKAPLYIDPALAAAAGVDLTKPIKVMVVNV